MIYWYNDIADTGGWITLEEALVMVGDCSEVGSWTCFWSVLGYGNLT